MGREREKDGLREREGKRETYSNCLRRFIYWKVVYWETVNTILMPSGRYFPFEI